MKTQAGNSRNSIEWMLIAKGIGIVLVVIGHFYPDTSPNYWSEIRSLIYSFHMPLFFLLSGYLYSHDKYSYSDLIKNKIKRLIYPFITIASLFFTVKYVVGRVVNLDHPVDIDSTYALLTDPVNSYMPLLWFVHALFLIFAVYPLARVLMNNLIMLILLLIINSFFGSDYLVFGKALANMPFFLVGVLLKENIKVFSITINNDWRYTFVNIVIFSLAYVMQYSVNINHGNKYFTIFFIGVVGSLLIINLSQATAVLSHKNIKSTLISIGYYSMTIYLFHTLFESTVRIAFIQVFKQMHAPFLLIAFFAITCGVVVPLALEKAVFRKYWVTRKLLLGIS